MTGYIYATGLNRSTDAPGVEIFSLQIGKYSSGDLSLVPNLNQSNHSSLTGNLGRITSCRKLLHKAY